MNIAIDLTSTPKDKTGIGRYLYNLVENLQEIDRKNEYFIFIQDDDLNGFNIRNANFHCIPVNSKVLRRTYLRLIWEQLVLPLRLKKLKVDLLHSPYYTTPYLSRTKSIVTFHDMTYFILPEKHTFIKRLLFKLFIRLSAKKAKNIITISTTTVYDIDRILKLKGKNIFVTPMGVDERFFLGFEPDKAILDSYGIKDEYFLYVGTIEPRKNILRLLKAYNSLDSSIKNRYKLVICGKKGWMFDDIFSYIELNGLHDYVHFSGFVKDEHLPNIYKGAKLFFYVSLYEGFGIPVLEGLASGTPCVTSNISPMKEVAGDAAIKVNPYDENEIKDAVVELLNDKELYNTLVERGKERAQKFSWLSCAKKTLRAYNEAFSDDT